MQDSDEKSDSNTWNRIIGGCDCIKDCIEDMKARNSTIKNRKHYPKKARSLRQNQK